MGLRLYQHKANNNVLDGRARRIRRMLVIMATGTGKSLCFGYLPQTASFGKRTLLIVHTRELVNQAAKHFMKWNPGVTVGVEMGDRITTTEQIVVASIQTIGRELSNKLSKFNPDDFDWIIVDEAHKATSDSYRIVFEHFGLFDPNKSFPTLVGFTATGERSDKQALGQVFEEIVFTYSIQDAIRDGWLSDLRGFRLRTETDITKVGIRAGEFATDQLEAAVNNPVRNEQIVDCWIREAYPRQTIGFTATVQHAKDLAFCFQKRGVPFQAIWGSDPDREEKIDQYNSGYLKGLLCAQLLVEGFDSPMTSCVLMAKPTKSNVFFTQAAGRGTRLDPRIDNLVLARNENRIDPSWKSDCLILDVCDVTSKHSLVTLPTLFGLSSNLDLKGKSVMAAAKEIEEAQAKHPEVDLTKLDDLSNLKTYIEQANLFKVTFCQEVVEHSLMQWHRSGDNSYRLILPGKERMLIEGNLLGQYSVNGSVLGTQVKQDGFSDLPSALSFAEANLSKHGKSILTLLRRDSKWHKAPISDGQRKLLLQFKVPRDVIDKMDKGSAAMYITKRLGGKK